MVVTSLAVVDGTTQVLTVRTAPVGAACTLMRNAAVLATIAATPATVQLHRERDDLVVTCEKPGWDRSVTVIPAKFTGVTAGNVLVGGLVGVVVDEATGANYRYDDDRVILLTPRPHGGPTALPLLPPRLPVVPGRPAGPAGSVDPALILSEAPPRQGLG